MTHHPKKPPEGGEGAREAREQIGMTRRALFGLLGRGSSVKEREPGTEPAEAQVARGTRGKLSRRAVVVAGLVGAAALGLTPTGSRPARAESGRGWPAGFTERYRIPDWGPEELNRLADAYSLLSGYRTNPSFWRYVTNHGMQGSIYKAIDAVLAHPELVHYKNEGDGVIRIIPRGPFPSLPAGLEIEIRGGLPHGRITAIRINGASLEIDPHASLTWEDYQELLQKTSQEYWNTLSLLYFLDQLVDMTAPLEKYKYYYARWAEQKLPPKVRRNLTAILEEVRKAIDSIKAWQTSGSSQKASMVKKITDDTNAYFKEEVKKYIRSVDLTANGNVVYATYDDYSGEVRQLPQLIKTLMAIRKKQGYLGPTQEDPNQNPAMDEFMGETHILPYPMLNADGTVVIDFYIPKIEGKGVGSRDIIAFTPDGCVLERTPEDLAETDPSNQWTRFQYPGGKSTRELVHAKYQAQLGIP